MKFNTPKNTFVVFYKKKLLLKPVALDLYGTPTVFKTSLL